MIVIGLCDPKSPSNVGSVMRAAGCFGATAVRYTGERFDRAAKYNTDTKNKNSTIPLSNVEDLVSELPVGCVVVCVELVIGAITLPEFVHPENALYIFGPEDGSISQRLIDRADHTVYVPTTGCMNLAASVNVLLYDRLSKSDNTGAGDRLIAQSRDQKNRLKVKQLP
jgi:tRNA(Leu) C34 or U34 (ribose-2'-O)-methylase TrmL